MYRNGDIPGLTKVLAEGDLEKSRNMYVYALYTDLFANYIQIQPPAG